MTTEEMRELDLLVTCRDCKALIGEPCTTDPLVHFCRRVDRLLKERGATHADLQRAIDNGTVLKGN